MKPLRGGIKLDGKKDATLIPWTIARPHLPRRVRIPFIQDADLSAQTARPRVQVGDRVRVGEKIADEKRPFSSALHASISGTVSRIGSFPHPLLGECEAVEILSDGKDERAPGIGVERSHWESLSASEVTQILRESGVGELGEGEVDTLILNGCESEPYLTSDHCLMMSHPVEILRGGEILRQALGARSLIVALEDNKVEVAELLKSKTFFHSWSDARVEVLPSRYPQGNEKILIRNLFGLEGGRGRFSEARVFDVAIAYAVYEAVVLQKPLYERVVTIAGECVAQPRNFWLRVGTLVEDAVKYSRGFLREPERVLLGGPMSGTALETLEVPILKGTPGILGLPREVAKPESVEPCIRCGRCVESCPVSISPVMITLASEKDLFETARHYGASFCIECGNCAYVCPAKRPMVELIQYANAH